MGRGLSLQLEWVSTAPPGTFFQVYVSCALTWHGTSRWVAIPMPSSRIRIDIGAVEPGEATTDFSAQSACVLSDRARLSWLGGSYLDPTGNDDFAGFRVHGEPEPGGGIDWTSPLAKICAYPGGILTDGYGLGPYGLGGFGRAASSYEWTSPAPKSGLWSFAVVSFDAAGNPGTPVMTSVAIQAPPALRPPLPMDHGSSPRTTRRPAP